MIYNCVIIDDEPLAQKIIAGYLQNFENIILKNQFSNAAEARAYLNINPADILFLDIEMPGENGIDLLKSLTYKPVTIFTTAYLHYSLEGFELGVLDYLVKPMRFERFEIAVKRAIEFLDLIALKTNLEKNSASELLIKSGNKKIALKRKSITHVQSMKDYAFIYCAEKKYVVRATMKEMEEMLGTAYFIRVHKSFVVSKAYLKYFSNMKIEFENFEIPVGRKYKDAACSFVLKE